MKRRFTIPYFPKGIQFVTPVIFGVGAYLMAREHPAWGVLLVLVGAIVLTTRYVTEIDLDRKHYRDYLSLLGLPLDETKEFFRHVDRIVITRGDYEQHQRSLSRDTQLEWSDYTATLIFDGEKTLDLITRTNKEELLKALKVFVDFLKVKVEDRSTDEHFWVDMTKV